MIEFQILSVLCMLKDFWLAYILISGQKGFPSQENPIVHWQVLSSCMNCKIYIIDCMYDSMYLNDS